MKFKLSKYIVPSVVSMVLVGTYTNIDGFFIGNVSGDDGLAAINIVWPIVAFITSLGTGIGVGGSVLMSALRGCGKTDDSENMKKSVLFALTVLGFIASAVLFAVCRPLVGLMGARGSVYKYACDYALVISATAVFQIVGSGLIAVLRNENKMFHSMIYTILSLAVHIGLDILLVGKYKLTGVAVSTAVSQFAVLVLCLCTLKIEKSAKVSHAYIMDILRASSAPFGVNFVPSLVLLVTNYSALKHGGTAAVSAYAVMSYAVYTYDYVYQGVCDGIQPVLSFYTGSGNERGKRYVIKIAVIILAVFSLIFILITKPLINVLPSLFKVSDTAEKMMMSGLVIYAVSYPFKAAVKMMCSYCYATEKFGMSNFLTYIDPIVTTPLFLMVLPCFAGINGVWGALTVSQITVTLAGAVLMMFRRKKAILTDCRVF